MEALGLAAVRVIEAKLKPGASELEDGVKRELSNIECGGEAPAALLAGGKGVAPGLALVSCAARLVEEYRVNVFLVLATRRTVDDVRAASEAAAAALGRPFIILKVRDDAGYMEVVARRIVKLLHEWGCGPIVCPTPGSIRSAVTVAAAGLSRGSGAQVEIVHLDYWWGPWNGLPYPLIPRSHEPLYAVVPVHGSSCRETRVAPEPKGLPERYARGELRRCIAAKAAELNRRALPPCNWLSFDSKRCTPLRIELQLPWHGPLPSTLIDECGDVLRVGGGHAVVVVRDWCKPRDWAAAARCAAQLAEMCTDNSMHCIVLRVLARASGLYWWLVGGRPLAFNGGKLLVDTNLVHGGVHIDWYMGARVAIPWGLVAEVERGYAEAVKDSAWYNQRLYETNLSRIAARVILREMLAEGVEVVPSGDPPLDTGILRVDPLILSKYTLVTEDKGAYELWKSHPLIEKGVARAALAERSLDPWTRGDIDERLRAARASYALLHVACLAEKLRATLPQQGKAALGKQLEAVKLQAESR